MRRLLFLTLLCAGCSLELPPDPITTGVLPTCSANSVVQAGTCEPLSSVAVQQAVTSETAASAPSAQLATHADSTELAQATRSLDPAGAYELMTPTTVPPIGVPAGPLAIFGGTMSLNGGLVLTRIGRFVSSNSVTSTNGAAQAVTLQTEASLGGAAVPSMFSLEHPGFLRVLAYGSVEGAGASTGNGFSNCQITIRVQDFDGNTTAQAIALVSAFDSSSSPPHESVWFAVGYGTAVQPGEYSATANIDAASGSVTPTCTVVAGTIHVDVDGT
jgi:hypothetical protein